MTQELSHTREYATGFVGRMKTGEARAAQTAGPRGQQPELEVTVMGNSTPSPGNYAALTREQALHLAAALQELRYHRPDKYESDYAIHASCIDYLDALLGFPVDA